MLGDVRAPLAAIRPMKVQHNVTTLCGTGLNDGLDEVTIRNALVFLLGAFAKPAILRQWKPDDIHVPFPDGGVDRVENVTFAIARPFQRSGIDSRQPHAFAFTVKQIGSNHLEWQRYLVALSGRGRQKAANR